MTARSFSNATISLNYRCKKTKKNKGDEQKAKNFCNKAIDFWLLTKEDPKNRHRLGEIDCAIEELQDYFQGNNIYGTTDEVLTRYYDAFLYRE